MREQRQVDIWLLTAALLLAGTGLIMVYSSSMYLSMRHYGHGSFYVKKQAINLLVGLVAMLMFAKLNYRGFAKIATGLLYGGFALLGVLLVQKFVNGYSVHRWLRIAGRGFQPSELMKVILIIYLAAAISRKGDGIRDFQHGFLPMLGVIGIAFGMIVMEPDLGIAGLTLAIGLVMLFVGRAKLSHLLVVTAPAGLVVALVAATVPYMRKRVELFLNPESGYQTLQSIMGIGSGGIEGVGLGNSTQKFLFLPENHTDFVFSIFAEETGLIGSTILLVLMFWYVYRGLMIAGRAPDLFGFLLAAGLSIMTAMQIIINIGVATRLLPTTGMTLPFLSYGGSSLVMSFISTGILLSISRQGNYERTLSREFGARIHKRGII